jgi:hypothetical protein
MELTDPSGQDATPWTLARGCGCLSGFVLGFGMLSVGFGIAIVLWRALITLAPVAAVVDSFPPQAGEIAGLVAFMFCALVGLKIADGLLRAAGRALLGRFAGKHRVIRQFLTGVFVDSPLHPRRWP